ncbi:cold-shock DEAD box protein A dbpA [Teredinibacter turnerae T7901]|uniref:ATP-dependent RNA helicase DeaD n=1 Tax=Teredinibacter turnerae (strain ATCC 39867 / T7901) TaxID=377629 RepID=C5BL95_TERTT|nr:DEAD/DEAH box helicase [Teredinibacter turnerae]ACR11189.1 cold-shock DEAD box protein A dbpA [Teredinibacter turnerae T7901]
MTQDTQAESLGFADLNLPSSLLDTVRKLGYERPSPIQAATIPALIEGRDVIGMAQTGTGKTAAFALPILAKIKSGSKNPQALVLCPTRELAIQVSEAFQSYAANIPNFHVLPIYGGQDMRTQLRGLQRGVQVIVGTPGRLLDHLDRRSLDLSELHTVVLDEADEMLRMGFNEDVEAILKKTPGNHQIALFSATMPPPIRRVADTYLKNPVEVKIETSVTTNENIEQFYWLVSGTNKLEALTRILEVEDFEGMIIFVRTKNSTVDLAERLNARGFSAAPLNGDMNQALRERTIEQLKGGKLDMIIATDVAARGLDVERISHVLNFDIPYDDEAYVHRIGRTGRGGRTGKAILFVAPRERRMLRSIEKTTRQKITEMQLPSRQDLIHRRTQEFKAAVTDSINMENKSFFQRIIAEMCHEQEISPEDVAAALAYLLQKDRPLLPPKGKEPSERPEREKREREFTPERSKKGELPNLGNAQSLRDYPEIVMERFRLDVGRNHNVSPREIVGAIANEADIDSCYIGQIKIFDDFSTVDLPAGMPDELFQMLKKTRVMQRPINLKRLDENGAKLAEANQQKQPPRNNKPRTNKPRKPAGKKRDFKGKDRS